MSTNIELLILSIYVLLATFLPLILDCDETYNYWDPLHYLLYGHGFQTWEYDPRFQIRSWAYLIIHAVLCLPIRILTLFRPLQHIPKWAVFQGLRLMFALFAFLADRSLRIELNRRYGQVGWIYQSLAAFSPGTVFARTAFLPSSLVMILLTFSLSISLRKLPQANNFSSFSPIGWIYGTMVFLGWPFSAILGIGSYILRPWDFLNWILEALRALEVAAISGFVDSILYKKSSFVAFKILKYNVLNNRSTLYGIEPISYYVKNLVLNFNIAFPLSILGLVALPSPICKTYIAYFLWILIFGIHPHKEERFLYPIYPYILIASSFLLHKLKNFKVISKIILVSFGVLSFLRIYAMYVHYSGYTLVFMDSYIPLEKNANKVLCMGSEWYRYPSSFFVPNTIRSQYIKSSFDGILPGKFYEDKSLPWFSRPATFMDPPNLMNDANIEETDRYMPLDQCDYLFAQSLPRTHQADDFEPDLDHYHDSKKNWTSLKCRPVLSKDNASFWWRVMGLPIGNTTPDYVCIFKKID